MKLLAIDTSTEACSCALYIDGETQSRSQLTQQQHTKLILPMADELLAEADIKPNQLDGIAVGKGPGSFTGLRIACGVAQGIAFAVDIPIAPISSLATLAQAAYIETNEQQVLAIIDARMEEVYYGYYGLNTQNIMQCQIKDQVAKPEDIDLPTIGKWYGTGSGWIYAEILKNKLGTLLQNYKIDKYPQADAMIPLALDLFKQGKVVAAENISPVYLRGMK